MPERIAVYPFSGNPPTIGHGDLLNRAAPLFDKVYWTAAYNPLKQYLFPIEERLEMMEVYQQHYGWKNVEIDSFTGSTVRYCQKKRAHVLIKGMRDAADFQTEFQQATGNRNIDPSIETLILFTQPQYSSISSSLVRELAFLNESLTPYVLEPVAELIHQAVERYRQKSGA